MRKDITVQISIELSPQGDLSTDKFAQCLFGEERKSGTKKKQKCLQTTYKFTQISRIMKLRAI